MSDLCDIFICLIDGRQISRFEWSYSDRYFVGAYDEEDAINIVKSVEGEREVIVLYKKSKMQMKHGEYRKVSRWKKEPSTRGESSSG